jgi:cytidine deaminase
MSDATALIQHARLARERAYAPYSGFTMGAAVETASGAIVDGALVENVSLGLAMCAERIALFSASTAGEKPLALALVAKRTARSITWPCGACLQVALELGGPDLLVYAADPDGGVEMATLAELLPRGPRSRKSAGMSVDDQIS